MFGPHCRSLGTDWGGGRRPGDYLQAVSNACAVLSWWESGGDSELGTNPEAATAAVGV